MSNEHKSQTLNKDNFTATVLESATPVLVDFWAEWCAPCRSVAPIVESVAEKFLGRLTVGKVNVDEEPDLAASYDIRSIPALLVFRNGEVVDEIVGAVPFGQLSKSVQDVLDAE